MGVYYNNSGTAERVDGAQPSIVNGSISEVESYWTNGSAASYIKKSGNLAIFQFAMNGYDSGVPSQGSSYTKIGKVSIKPINNVDSVLPDAGTSDKLRLVINTNGEVQVYNYGSTAHAFNTANSIVYFTND